MIRINDGQKHIATVKSYIQAQEYAEKNKLPTGKYYLVPTGIKTLAGIKVMEVVYVKVGRLLIPTAEILDR